jgi:signal transduction histidine kinase
MKSDFLTRLSHELRTRLNSIIGFSEALKDGVAGPMSARQQQRVRGIVEIGRHMLSLAQDIHDHSKVEAGKVRLALEAVDLASLCASTMCIIRERAESRCIRLEIDAPVELEPIQADLRMCKQILLNLLANAVNFTHYGGKVTLRVRRVCRAEISRPSGSWAHRGFALADDGFAEFLEISVTDSGIGISADSMNRLFEPFTQIDSGPVRRADGTGLGLANVKLFAELHGGSVAVESALGEGSRFAVWLPLQAAQEDVLASATQMARPPLETLVRPRIARLVKDDLRSAERIGVQLEAVRFSAIASDVVANESGIASG